MGKLLETDLSKKGRLSLKGALGQLEDAKELRINPDSCDLQKYNRGMELDKSIGQCTLADIEGELREPREKGQCVICGEETDNQIKDKNGTFIFIHEYNGSVPECKSIAHEREMLY